MTLFHASAAALLITASTAAAASFTSAFSTGTEGWTANGGFLSYEPSGGNPGGYLFVDDSVGTEMFVTRSFAPGSLALLDEGEIGFDFIEFINPNSNFGGAGNVTLLSHTTSETATLDLITGDPGTTWVRYSSTLTEALWTPSGALDWSTFLSDISEIRVNVESGSEVTEEIGFDNFSVEIVAAPIPLPASLPLLAVGAAGLFAMRRLKTGRA